MRRNHLIVALIGLALLMWVIARVRVPGIVHDFSAFKVAVPVVLALSLCRLILQTSAWSQALKDQRVSIPARQLVGVRVASQGMGYLTILGPVLSEPMKVKLLGTPAEPTITATLLDDGVYWFTTILLAIAGWLSIPMVAIHGMHTPWVAAAVLGLVLVLFFILSRKSILSLLLRRLRNRSPRWLVRAAILEGSIRNYRGRRPALVKRMFWIDVLCQLLVALEVVVALWALHLPIHFLPVVAIEGITRGFKLITGWIPARLGSDEGGAISAFALAGFSPGLGLALALTRRVRDLLWALCGLAWLLLNSRKDVHENEKSAKAPTAILKEAF
jgi:hypothetical protein